MEVFDREKWIREDCVYTHTYSCVSCPHVVTDETGYFKCDKKRYENCYGIELYAKEFAIATPYSKNIHECLVKLWNIRTEIAENIAKEEQYLRVHDELWGSIDDIAEAYHNVSNGYDSGEVLIAIMYEYKNNRFNDLIDPLMLEMGNPKTGVYPEIKNGKLYWKDLNRNEALYWSDEANSYVIHRFVSEDEINILGFVRVVPARIGVAEDLGWRL